MKIGQFRRGSVAAISEEFPRFSRSATPRPLSAIKGESPPNLIAFNS